MKYRFWLVATSVTHLLLACGGDAKSGGSAGTAGSSATAGGQLGNAGSSNAGQANGTSSEAGHGNGGSSNAGQTHGGSSNAGQANGGSSNGSGGRLGTGGALICCAAVPTCPANERQAQGSECPGNASCHQLTLCCSSIWCVANDGAAGAAGSAGVTMHDCNGLSCSASQACVAYRTVGGPLLLSDGGACPTGQHLENNRCQADFAYKCADLNGACQNQMLSCGCAQPPTHSPGVCPTGYNSCSQSATSADPSAQLICQQLAP